jgi:AraC family transcriptional regulator of adaptative response / DNA-3-methyladenine glycosylase II
MHSHRAPAPPHRRTAAPIRCPLRLPYDWDGLLSFLRARATPGVEEVSDGCYRRTIQLGGRAGVVSVGLAGTGRALVVDVQGPPSLSRLAIAQRACRVFDVDTDINALSEHLSADPLLGPVLARHPGVRVPGAWDGFELAVRAVLGQQVSVRAATTIAGRVATQFGTEIRGDPSLTRLFPAPAALADAAIEQAGVLPARARTIRTLAQRVADGAIDFDVADTTATLAALREIPGIGPWTTAYIAMRACGDRDAFLTGDRVLRRAAGGLETRALDRRAERWRPWRAYAVMLLWKSA